MKRYRAMSRVAQRERVRQKSCVGKRRYPDQASAVEPNVAVYRCRFCGGWHRTHAVFALANRLAAERARRRQKPRAAMVTLSRASDAV